MNKQRYLELKAERDELVANHHGALAEISTSGQYGQVAQRLVDAAEHAEYALKLWDDAFGEEFKALSDQAAEIRRQIRERNNEQARIWNETCRSATSYDIYGGDRP